MAKTLKRNKRKFPLLATPRQTCQRCEHDLTKRGQWKTLCASCVAGRTRKPVVQPESEVA